MSKPRTICAVILMLGASAANGQTWYVDDDNCPGPGSGTKGDPFCTIQAGIDAAGAVSTVVVAQGTYVERINLLGKDIQLRSTNPEDPAVVAATIIDGDAGGSVITCNSGETYTSILGFTITNGDAANGGGMFISNSRALVQFCTFTGNSASGYGGGVYCASGTPFFFDCTFTGNSAGEGGGMASNFSNVLVSNCTFTGNSAGNRGGGVFKSGSNSGFPGLAQRLWDCTFDGNSAGGRGGGVFSSESDPLATVKRCTFSGNTANEGGGMYNYAPDVTVTDCTFTDNSARLGGGLESRGGSLTDCTFSGNTAINSGGGMGGSDSTLTNCTFIGNSSTSLDGTESGDGGGMSSTNCTLTNCAFIGNSSDLLWGRGGGMKADGDTTLTNCTFVGNSADNAIPYPGGDFGYGEGGGLWAQGSPTLTNCIFWGNTAYIDPQIFGGSPTVTYTCIEDGWDGQGNIDDDPLFSAGPDGCLYLSQTTAGLPFDSPCLDAGSDTAGNLGLEAMTTRRDEVGDAGIIDMGYHYLVTEQPFNHGDFDRDGNLDLDDFSEWTAHVTGPCAAEPCWPTAYPDPCGNIADFDDDGDIDLHDFGLFQQQFSGSPKAGPPRAPAFARAAWP